LYDGLLQIDLPVNCNIIAYADDALILIKGEDIQTITEKANSTLKIISKWGINNKLHFNPHKTTAMLVTKKKNVDVPLIKFNSEYIQTVSHFTYLGVVIDSRMLFRLHFDNLAKKASKFHSSLVRAAKPTWGLNSDILRIIYHGAFEPSILYCTSALRNILDKKWAQKKLLQIQRGFILRITQAFRTISTDAALIIAGIAPLYLTAIARTELLSYKQGKLFLDEGVQYEIEQRANFLSLGHPRNHLHPVVNSRCLCKHDVYIYTDGSRTQGEDGKSFVGCAFTAFNNGTEIFYSKYRLAPVCSVYQAELFAILQAIRWSTINKTNSCILSDSQAALLSVRNNRNLHPIALDIRSEFKNHNNHICLSWVRGHTGIVGNERADELAKEAASADIPYSYIKCPISYIKCKMKEHITSNWNSHWSASDKGSVTKNLFFPQCYIFPVTVQHNFELTPKCKSLSAVPENSGQVAAHSRFRFARHKTRLMGLTSQDVVPTVTDAAACQSARVAGLSN
ncbi:hypothetical protein ANN_12377, partial [Periplaneta americana]